MSRGMEIEISEEEGRLIEDYRAEQRKRKQRDICGKNKP